MKNILKIMTMVLIFLSIFSIVSAQTLTAPMYDESGALDIDSLPEAREVVWNNWVESIMADEEFQAETENFVLDFEDVQMRYNVQVFGEKPDDGYALYIAMHGGGYDDTGETNDAQWEDMMEYYTEHLDGAVYVAVRGIRDTWDTHFNPESYPLYDKLIEYMILSENVNPNKVYLTGFSAGGDGVYAIGARMADRFAAANMSSGHPNGISMINFYNLPLTLQAGEFDDAYDRNIVTAEYGVILDELQAENPEGYIHRTLIHTDRGHNYEDYDNKPVEVYSDIQGYLSKENLSTEMVDSYPPDWMTQYERNPLPESIRWDLDTRADLRFTDSFYYLSAPKDAHGLINVVRDGNTMYLNTENLEGDFIIYFNEEMIDFSEPVHFVLNDDAEVDVMLIPEEYYLNFTTYDRGDPFWQFEAAISYQWLLEQISK